MKRATALLMLMLVALSVVPAAANDNEPVPQWVAESRQAAADLGKNLVSTLQHSMASDGPVAAVEFCNLQAPVIAGDVAAEHSMSVGRTALRVRNQNNLPDHWEQRMLAQMQQQLAAGEPASQVEVFAVHNDDGVRTGRWMRAIPTQPMCLSCHGSNIAPEVAAAIDSRYPQDQARGFAVGELRGAFTVSVPLDD